MGEGPECCRRAEWPLPGPPSARLERVTALVPGTTAVDRRSIDTIHPSARADQQAPLPMFRCPGLPGVP